MKLDIYLISLGSGGSPERLCNEKMKSELMSVVDMHTAMSRTSATTTKTNNGGFLWWSEYKW